MKKKIIALLLTVLLITSLNSTIFAAVIPGNDMVAPCWENITSITSVITFNEDTEIGTFGSVINGNPGTTRIVATAKLYYMNVNNRWFDTYVTWHYDEDTDILGISGTFDADPGVTYKVITTITVYSENYIEPVTDEVIATFD